MVSHNNKKAFKSSSSWVVITIFYLLSSYSHTFASEAPSEIYLPSLAINAAWTFSGIVTNENGESYGYYFRMERLKGQLSAIATVYKQETQEIVLQEKATAVLVEAENKHNWKAEGIFLKFNPINGDWIFGVKSKEKTGFNFKVDMLSLVPGHLEYRRLTPNINMIITQTSHLNGHLHLSTGEKEQFVTAKNAWFSELAYKNPDMVATPFSEVLCRFADGSGFYSVQVKEDRLKNEVNISHDAEGKKKNLGLVGVSQNEKGWQISLSSKNKLNLDHPLTTEHAIAGFVDQEQQLGFCLLVQDSVRQQTV
jgi:hypothetical protein